MIIRFYRHSIHPSLYPSSLHIFLSHHSLAYIIWVQGLFSCLKEIVWLTPKQVSEKLICQGHLKWRDKSVEGIKGETKHYTRLNSPSWREFSRGWPLDFTVPWDLFGLMLLLWKGTWNNQRSTGWRKTLYTCVFGVSSLHDLNTATVHMFCRGNNSHREGKSLLRLLHCSTL